MSAFDQTQLETLFQQGRYKDLVEKSKIDKIQYHKYYRIKWRSVIYTVGDSIRFENNQAEWLGQIISIDVIKSFQNESWLPFIQVNVYFAKQDIKYKEFDNSFSIYELFLTDLKCNTNFYYQKKEYILVDKITNVIKVVSLKEYDETANEDIDDLYFTRMSYNTGTKKLNPDPSNLEKVCICQTPINPDLRYIGCEKCNKWIHLNCVKLTEKEADQIEQYICPDCQY